MLRALCEEWADASTVIGLWAFALPGRTKNEVLSMKLIVCSTQNGTGFSLRYLIRSAMAL